MGDIVERLKWIVEEGGYNDNITDFAQSCADEIERLRRALVSTQESVVAYEKLYGQGEAADEIDRLRTAGDDLVAAIRSHDLRESHLQAWEEARRG